MHTGDDPKAISAKKSQIPVCTVTLDFTKKQPNAVESARKILEHMLVEYVRSIEENHDESNLSI